MSAMTAAISNFMWRRTAERVDTEETDVYPLSDVTSSVSADGDEEEGEFVGHTNTSAVISSTSGEALSYDDDDDGGGGGEDVEAGTRTTAVAATASLAGAAVVAPTGTVSGGRVSASSPAVVVLGDLSSSRRPRISLRDLEEERDIVRRRTSVCVLLSSFILLRLWIQAVFSGDFGLLLLCLVFTSWTARFIRHTRDREEELDRMIANFDETNTTNDDDVAGTANDARLRRMSFQSQLALAILESQMQMMQGGYGNPDGGDNRPGVSEAGRRRWERFEHRDVDGLKKKGDYGAVGQADELEKGHGLDGSDEEPHCSICLGEYEHSDKLVRLPCGHIFHEDCITSWTDHNTRCPLCNFDLESTSGENAV
jgi:hypothetical protein